MKDLAIFILDSEGRVLSWNAGAEGLEGYQEDEILGRSFSVFFAPRAQELRVPERLLRETAERGSAEDAGWRLRKNGTPYRAETVLVALPVQDGAIPGFAAAMFDRSELERYHQRSVQYTFEQRAREAAEQAKERAEQHARNESALREAAHVLASMGCVDEVLEKVAAVAMQVSNADGAYVERVDRAGNIEVVAAAGWGHPPLRTKMPYSGSLAEEVLQSAQPTIVANLAGEMRPMARRLQNTCGECSILAAPLRPAEGVEGALILIRRAESLPFSADEPQRLLIVADMGALALRRLTALEQAQRHARNQRVLLDAAVAVAASETVDRMLTQVATSAVVAMDADGAVVERLDPEEGELEIVACAGDLRLSAGTSVPYRGSLAEQARGRREPLLISRLSEDRAPFPPHWQVVCPNCSALVLWMTEAGATIGALILLRSPEHPPFDEQEAARGQTLAHMAALALRQAHLREDAEQSHRKLEQVSESRVRLMRGFSHDVKNPLNAALGYVELLEQGVMGTEPTPEQRSALERIRKGISSAVVLINDLVELARAEAGRIEIEPVDVDVCAAAHDVVDQYAPAAERKHLRIMLDLPADLPPLRTDVNRVRQIVGNMVANAVKFTPDGGAVEIRAVPHVADAKKAKGRRRFALHVVDTGPGIAPEDRERIFHEFTRLDPEASDGAGLGLSVSRRLARLLGGDLTVESEPGRGSDFTLWLPEPPDRVGAT